MFKEMFRRFQPMLDLDGGGGAGTGVEAPEVAEPVVEEGAEEQDLAEPVIEDAEPTGKNDQDAAFASMRRELEELRRRNAELESSNTQYDETLGLWFEGDNKLAQAKAHYEGKPVEQILADMETAKQAQETQKQLDALKAENETLRYNQLKAQDLAELKAHGVKDIKDVEELGEAFFKYRANGLSPKEAYDFIKMKEGTPPKSMGSIKSSPAEKEFLTRDEVMSMSSEERFKNVEKIRKSMVKW